MYAGTLMDAPAAGLRRDGRTAAAGMRIRIAACAGSAALYGALFPPFELVWLAPMALAPYLWALAGLAPARAALLGLLWATLATAAVAWWLPEMLAGYFGLGPLAAIAGLVGVGLLAAGRVAPGLGLVAQPQRRQLTQQPQERTDLVRLRADLVGQHQARVERRHVSLDDVPHHATREQLRPSARI